MPRYRVMRSRFRPYTWYLVVVAGPGRADVSLFPDWRAALDMAISYADRDRLQLVA